MTDNIFQNELLVEIKGYPFRTESLSADKGILFARHYGAKAFGKAPCVRKSVSKK